MPPRTYRMFIATIIKVVFVNNALVVKFEYKQLLSTKTEIAFCVNPQEAALYVNYLQEGVRVRLNTELINDAYYITGIEQLTGR